LPDEETYPGQGVVQASWAGTVIFALTAILGTLVSAADIVALVVSVAMFLIGTGVFFAAFVRAVNRSRTDEIGVMNLFFLDTSAPRPVRLSLLASFLVEVVVAIATAALRTNTSIAFGILAPVYGLSLSGLWGARYGTFPKRAPKPAAKQKRPTTPRQ